MNADIRMLLSDIRSLPRPAWLLFLGTFVNRFGSFVVPFLMLYLTAEGYSTSQAGLALSAYGVGTLAAALVLSRSSVREGARVASG